MQFRHRWSDAGLEDQGRLQRLRPRRAARTRESRLLSRGESADGLGWFTSCRGASRRCLP